MGRFMAPALYSESAHTVSLEKQQHHRHLSLSLSYSSQFAIVIIISELFIA